jgi:2-dehydro-3-deoxyphosphogluconate aldolase / (4S)-4-hydroxy-2-oxoglutarate aldolase
MNRIEVVQRTRECGLIAVFRTNDTSGLIEAAEAVIAGGIDVIEFTLTMPNALSIVEKARAKLPNTVAVGAGTVLDAETARMAILAGAQFVVSPGLDIKMIEMCHRYGIPAVPGALTPTEIMQAWQAGADLVKIFPAYQVGPRYIAEISGPFPGIPFVASSIGSLDTIPEYMAVGTAACCLLGNGIGGDAYTQRKFDQMTQAARQLSAAVQQGRLKK